MEKQQKLGPLLVFTEERRVLSDLSSGKHPKAQASLKYTQYDVLNRKED